jgi:hypothetical protein
MRVYTIIHIGFEKTLEAPDLTAALRQMRQDMPVGPGQGYYSYGVFVSWDEVLQVRCNGAEVDGVLLREVLKALRQA